jgi:hypothetical protein
MPIPKLVRRMKMENGKKVRASEFYSFRVMRGGKAKSYSTKPKLCVAGYSINQLHSIGCRWLASQPHDFRNYSRLVIGLEVNLAND